MQAKDELEKRRSALSTKKQALLAKMLSRQGDNDAPQFSISRKSQHFREFVPISILPRTGSDDFFPASFAQRRLWFLDQLQHGSPVYNNLETYCFTGDLHIVALKQSLNEIIKRHETLRTTFLMMDGRLMQRIAPHLTIELSVHNLEELPVHEQEAAMMQLAVVEAQRPFDLEAGPLIRAWLLRQTQTKHMLLLALHHIISDGWSMGVLYQELTALYDAYSKGKPSPLTNLPVQYADYAAWQQEWLQDSVLEPQLAYWKQQLAGAPPLLELPFDKPRPPVETFRGTYERFTLPSSLIAELENIARREGVTLFMILLTALMLLLSYASSQDDIVVGTDVANRRSVEIERLIGFFVNQLVLRADLSGNPTLSELLQRVRKAVLDAYEHQDVPFDQLVKALNPVRHPDRSPLFQTKLVLQHIPAILPSSSAVTIARQLIDNGTAQLDLLLILHQAPSGELQGFWQYNTDLFEAKTIARMNQHFSVILKTLATSLAYKLSDIKALLDQVDREHRHSQQRQLAQLRHHRLKTVQTKPFRLSGKETL